MSYCVHCGVELDDSAKKCALCGTPVIDPARMAAAEKDGSGKPAASPFPNKIVLPPKKAKAFGAAVTTCIFLLVGIVCCIVNLILTPGQYWIIPTAASLILVWVVLVLPFWFRTVRPYLLLVLDSLFASVFAWVLCATGDRMKWFLQLILPIIGLSFCVGLLLIWYFKGHKRRVINAATMVLCAVALLCSGVDIIFHISAPNLIVDVIMLCFGVSAVLGALLLIMVTSSKRMTAWIQRRFFI